MPPIIDFHAHAFPDQVAALAIPALEEAGKVTACLDPHRFIAFKHGHSRHRPKRHLLHRHKARTVCLDPFLVVGYPLRADHPFSLVSSRCPRRTGADSRIRKAGFLGIKMHPYYQDFVLNEERMWVLYEKIADEGLILVMHTGFDIGFPRERIADPRMVAAVMDRLPGLKFVATHFGSWDLWDEVEELLLGREVYVDLSYALHLLPKERAREMALAHPEDYLLFGTDYPWADQQEVLAQISALGLGARLEEKILGGNAARLFAAGK